MCPLLAHKSSGLILGRTVLFLKGCWLLQHDAGAASELASAMGEVSSRAGQNDCLYPLCRENSATARSAEKALSVCQQCKSTESHGMHESAYQAEHKSIMKKSSPIISTPLTDQAPQLLSAIICLTDTPVTAPETTQTGCM